MTLTADTSRTIQPKPLAITIGIHMLLLLLLVVCRFTLPARTSTLPEMGMEVNLGTSADGSGTNQPMDVVDPAAMAINASRRSVSAASDNTDVERSNDDNAPSLADASHRRAQQSNTNVAIHQAGNSTTQTAARAVQPQRPRYVYPGSTGHGGNSAAANMPGTSEGNTSGNGDRGVPGGTPGSPNYEGSPGTGTGGISYKLDGRNIVAFPPREAKFREGGRVVVRVTVDRDGEIVNKQIVSSTNTELSPIALRKLSQVRFNKSVTAPAEQFGNITFEFKTRQ